MLNSILDDGRFHAGMCLRRRTEQLFTHGFSRVRIRGRFISLQNLCPHWSDMGKGRGDGTLALPTGKEGKDKDISI